MSSETITRNDLQAILNEVLPSTSVASNVWISNYAQAASTTVSYDIGYNLISTNFTTHTGHFIAIGVVPLKTSRFTSRAVIKINNIIKGIAGTNHTTLCTVAPMVDYKGIKGETYTVELCIGSQDSGTTASTEAYNHCSFIIFDVNDDNNGLIPMEDYIIEQGTEGIWTYRKWASGIAECWGNNTIASSSFAAWGSVYYSTTYSTVSFPTNLFVDAPTLTTTALSGPDSWVARSGTVTKDSAGSTYMVRGATSTAYSYTIGYHAIGRWK